MNETKEEDFAGQNQPITVFPIKCKACGSGKVSLSISTTATTVFNYPGQLQQPDRLSTTSITTRATIIYRCHQCGAIWEPRGTG